MSYVKSHLRLILTTDSITNLTE